MRTVLSRKGQSAAKKMGSRYKWASLALLFALLGAAHSKKKRNEGVEIITESKPEDCTLGAELGDKLTVHYTGAFTSGKVFDSSRSRDPFTIELGAKQVIPGWEEGLLGMCEGEVRKLIIPPHLAYGERGVEGVIPGGATLIFSVELLELRKPSMITWNRDTLTVLGVIVLAGMLVYEVIRRARKESEDAKQQKKATKKGSKKKH